MNSPNSTASLDRAAPAIDALIGTLHAEADALGTMDALMKQQLDALRAGTPDALEDAAAEVHDCAATLDALKQKRARQTRLLGRVLGFDDEPDSLQAVVDALRNRTSAQAGSRLADARSAVRGRAEETQQRSETLRFTLEYAADLNRGLLLAMQGANGGAERQTYTAAGRAQASNAARSFLNTVG